MVAMGEFNAGQKINGCLGTGVYWLVTFKERTVPSGHGESSDGAKR